LLWPKWAQSIVDAYFCTSSPQQLRCRTGSTFPEFSLGKLSHRLAPAVFSCHGVNGKIIFLFVHELTGLHAISETFRLSTFSSKAVSCEFLSHHSMNHKISFRFVRDYPFTAPSPALSAAASPGLRCGLQPPHRASSAAASDCRRLFPSFPRHIIRAPADRTTPNPCGQSRFPFPNGEKMSPDGTDALPADGARSGIGDGVRADFA
jgi:hypothetical protein